MSHFRLSPEKAIPLVLLAMSILALVFMGQLVAAPKVLMGRSLTAIEPSLFPKLMIASLAVLSALVLLMSFIEKKTTAEITAEASAEEGPTDWNGIRRAVLLFAFMLFFALTMKPFGFLISASISMLAISVLVGNRSVLQISLLVTLAPAMLYLAATRILAVSLPELNFIELFYAQTLGI